MSISSRERYIGLTAGLVIAALLLDQFLLTPFLARHAAMAAELETLERSTRQASDVLSRQQRLSPEWAGYQDRGLKTVYAQAEGQTTRAILDWAQSAGVNLAGLKAERVLTQDRFQIISFHVTATGNLASLSRLIWQIETAALPVKLNDVQFAPRKENTDDLTLQLTVSTLSQGGKL